MDWKCPVCGCTQFTDPEICPVCGYDKSTDWMKYPTLICSVRRLKTGFVYRSAQEAKRQPSASSRADSVPPKTDFAKNLKIIQNGRTVGKYTGQMLNHVPSGQGIMVYSDGAFTKAAGNLEEKSTREF